MRRHILCLHIHAFFACLVCAIPDPSSDGYVPQPPGAHRFSPIRWWATSPPARRGARGVGATRHLRLTGTVSTEIRRRFIQAWADLDVPFTNFATSGPCCAAGRAPRR